MLSLNSEPRSFWHALPAGPKLLALLLATGLAMWLPNAAAAAMAFLGVMGLYALAGWAFLRQGLLALRPVLFVAALILAWHGWALSWEQGGLVVARMLALIALANLVSMTTALADLLDRVERALAWLRVAPLWRQRLALSVGLVVRFTPVLILKGQQLQRAWQARSHRRPGWRLMLPFVLGALDDAETVSEALRARTGTL